MSKGDVGSCDSHLTKRMSLFQVKSRCEVMRLTLPPKRVSTRRCYVMRFTIPHKTLVTLREAKGDIPQNAS